MKCVVYLVKERGVKREQISLIWGGDHTLNRQPITDQQFLVLADKFKRDMGLSRKEMSQLEDYLLYKGESTKEKEERLKLIEECKKLGLGTQSRTDRQENIDRFQSGKSLYCLFTFKSGGVGLSLHHSDELTTQKVRRKKESGYAVEEDIPKIPTRPRKTYLGPTFSAIELVQGLGRVPRIASLSPTNQYVVFYRGTAEEDVAHIVSMKLRCLGKVVKAKEGWEGAIYKKRDDDKDRVLLSGATVATVAKLIDNAENKVRSNEQVLQAEGEEEDFDESMNSIGNIGTGDEDDEESE